MSASDALAAIFATGRLGTSIDWDSVLVNQYKGALVNPRTIVDCGAHAGTHTVHFAAMARKTEAFEAIPVLAEALAQRFDPAVVTVHNIALAEAEGEREFHYKPVMPGLSGFRNTHAKFGTPVEVITVKTRTLDSFEMADVDYIKIDTEGAEAWILAGADRTIRTSRPLISAEYGKDGYTIYGLEKDTLWRIAEGLDYWVADLFGNPFLTPSDYDRCVDAAYWDFLLIPKENAELQTRLARNGAMILAAITERGQYAATPI